MRLALALLLPIAAYAQTCVTESDAPVVRGEGLLEFDGKIRLLCQNPSGNTTPFQILFDREFTGLLNINREATLTLGEPPVVYSAETGGVSFRFANVVLPAGGSTARIRGFRRGQLNGNFVAGMDVFPRATFITAPGLIDLPERVVVACPAPSQATHLLNANGEAVQTLTVSASAASLTHQIVFRELIPNAHRNRAAEPGAATQGTRLSAQFRNLPVGATLAVSVNPLGGPTAVLTAADENGAGPLTPFPASPAYVPLVVKDGKADAFWEIISSDPAALETLTFGVIAAPAAPWRGPTPRSPAVCRAFSRYCPKPAGARATAGSYPAWSPRPTRLATRRPRSTSPSPRPARRFSSTPPSSVRPQAG